MLVCDTKNGKKAKKKENKKKRNLNNSFVWVGGGSGYWNVSISCA